MEEEPLSSENPKQEAPMESPVVAERPWYILPAIVISQFAGTALWFAGNAVLSELVDEWDLPESSLGFLTSSVQLGFICGTLVFALLGIADRFPPTKVFFSCATAGAALNALIPVWEGSLGGLILLRFFTGFFLAGIYPVGMKVAADWFSAGLGKALGWLVGALAFGSSVPFLLRKIPQSWQGLLWETSAIAFTGGVVIGFLIPNGPYRKPGKKLDPTAICTIFRESKLLSASMAYWGHMWELYAFWTWCPVVWEAYLETRDVGTEGLDESIITFLVIASGGIGCVLGGYLTLRIGSAWVAAYSLMISGSFCLLSPALFLAPLGVTLPAYILWGMAVVADSPQFSTLVAQSAPEENKGTALTIVNCVGFAITIGSIQLLGVSLSEQYLFILLAPGPMFGLWGLKDHLYPPSPNEKGTELNDATQDVDCEDGDADTPQSTEN
eukprot:Nitzschia sp. Nitz4//scaffold92_size79448//71316//72638//NITZ4_005404-RA/size79448-processed-gene-0.64-mRNA-1//1//CDS//3329560225//7890//frame0